MAATLGNNEAVKTVKGKPRLPAEPRFWKRYSKHHEFPLSVVSSIFVHLLVSGLVVLVVTGALLSLLGLKGDPVPMESVIVDAGGAGNPKGVGAGPANAFGGQQENVQENDKQFASEPKENPKLATPQKPPTELLEPEKNDKSRPIKADTSAADAQLASIRSKLQSQLQDVMPGKGSGGPKGSGGGEGQGNGPGKGDGSGPGVQSGPATIHQKRQNRWTLIFDTRDGIDYLRQLHGLDATLAVSQSGGGHIVYRKLGQRPPRGNQEDIGTIPGLHWYDTKPESVRSLAMALSLEHMPEYIIAFFPPSLENHLRKLEEEAYSGPEDEIEETYFRVVRRSGGRYDVVVDEIKSRR